MSHAHATALSSSGRHTTASADGTNQPSAANDSGSSASSNKRKRSAQGCVVAENDVIVEELQKIRGKIRESSHLAGNYGRAIFSLQNHTEPITSAREAKQLRNIGNYIANQIQSILQKHQIRSRGDAPVPAATRTASASEPAARLPPPPPPHSASANEGSSHPPVATVPSAARRPYLPAEGKQPWYVLCALKEHDADSAPKAVPISVLLSKMQAAGYDGNLAKLRVCLTSLLNTHQIISKTSDGGIFLNDRGVQSAQLCIGQPHRLATQEQVGLTTSVQVQSNTSGGSSAAYGSAHTVAAYQATSVIEERARIQASEAVCIDLSDSDGDGYDSDTATIRATSMSPIRRPHGEPDAEPGSSIPPRPYGQSVDPLDGLVRGSDEWEIVLLLDHREVLSRRNRDILERKLLEVNVTCEVRSLNVGDVQWVARRYRGFEAAEEFMLNVIVERKEVKDLSGSIIDRRYNEQKTRLRDSGMTHVIYLVEGSLTQQTTVRSSGLQTALCRTQVQNQFFVQQCQNADESVAFLRGVHMNLLAKLPVPLTCRNREREPARFSQLSSSTASTVDDWKRQFCLPIRTYTDFNEQFRKKADFTVGEIYQMMLMQVHGLSSSRTVALAAEYPTFQHLAKAIARCEKLQDVRYGENQRRLGAKTHEFIKFLFESTDYERDPPSVNGGSGGGGVLE